MLNYNGKPLEELSYEECVELEKQIMKRILGADRAGMSQQIIDQLTNYNNTVKLYKNEALDRMKMGMDGKKESMDDTSFIIGEQQPDPEEDED